MKFHIGTIITGMSGMFLSKDIDELYQLVDFVYSTDEVSTIGLLDYTDPLKEEMALQFPDFLPLCDEAQAIDWKSGEDKTVLRDRLLASWEERFGAYHDVRIASKFVRQLDDVAVMAKHSPQNLHKLVSLDLDALEEDPEAEIQRFADQLENIDEAPED